MRLTIDYGIDLGTTNSAIARQSGSKPGLLCGSDGNTLLPSAVHIDAAGRIVVGEEALARRGDDAANTAQEFKRLMGTGSRVNFPATGKSLMPEDLSAEILRHLAARAASDGEGPLRAAVITVPAMFHLPQCEATRRAASLAGIEHAPLLQEPIAAAIAHAGTGTVKDGYWLVYDFGGGTFDVSLVRCRGGRLQVLDHDGDNHLGGKDLNRAVVRSVVEQVRQGGKLGAFSRTDPAFAAAFSRLTTAAEQTRLRLSDVEHAELVVEHLAQAANGEWVDVRMAFDREQLIALLRPTIARTVELCKKLVARNQLVARELHGLVLVGGPTRAPFLAPLLEAELGIETCAVADPMTIVALGAALFASTQKLPPALRARSASSQADEVQLRLEFESMTTNERPLLVGWVEDGRQPGKVITVRIRGEDGSFDSGRLAVSEKNTFSTSLLLRKGQLNVFQVQAFSGERALPTSPASFTVLHGTSIGKPPLSQSVGVMLADNSTRWYLRKGEALPARKTVTHTTTEPVRRGQAGFAINVPLLQGEHDRANRNKVIGILKIGAEKMSRDLPAGSEVQVTLSVDEFSNTMARGYVPLLDAWFDDVVTFQMDTQEKSVVQRGLDEQKDRLSALDQLAQELEGQATGQLDGRLREIESLIEEGDDDSVQLAEQLVRVATVEIDKAEKDAGYQRLLKDFDERAEQIRGFLTDHGKPSEQQELQSLIREFYAAIEHQDEALATAKRIRVEELLDSVLYRTPAYWHRLLTQFMQQLADLGMAEMAQSDYQEGVAAANKPDLQGLIAACRKLYERLPRDEKSNTMIPGGPVASITSHVN